MGVYEEWNLKLDEQKNLGFNAAYQLREDAKEMMPQQVLDIVHKFKDNWHKIGGAEGGSNDNAEQYIAGDLAKVCASITPETPEMAAELIKTTKELFAYNQSPSMSAYELETYDKQARYLGDEKVASAFIEATSQSFAKMDSAYDKGLPAFNKYIEIATNHPNLADKVLDTTLELKNKFGNVPGYKEITDSILGAISKNDKVKEDVRTKALQHISKDEQQTKTKTDAKAADGKKEDQKKSFLGRLKERFEKRKEKNKKTNDDKKKNMLRDSKLAELIKSKRVSKVGQHTAKNNGAKQLTSFKQTSKDDEKLPPIVAEVKNRQVQTSGDIYHALETYARIAAIKELTGVSGLSYNGMNESQSLDVLKQASPKDLQQAISDFKSSTEKNPIGNAGFNSRIVDVAQKIPEQLEKESNTSQQSGKEMNIIGAIAAKRQMDSKLNF